jgi:hypothetical protein
MTSVSRAKKAYDRAVEAEAKIRTRRKSALLSLIEACAHSTVLEGDYKPSNFLSSMPPFRVCTLCGLAEEGWGCGYSLLQDRSDRSVEATHRDTARKKVVVFLDNNTSFNVSRGRKSIGEAVHEEGDSHGS